MNVSYTRATAGITTSFGRMGTRIASIVGGALDFGAGFAVAGITRGVRSAVSELSELGKEARAASLPAEDLQGLMRGLERSITVSGEQSSNAFRDFNQRVGEAAQGTGELNRVVQNCGLSLTDANGTLKTQRQLQGDLADLIRRAQIVRAAFGAVGPELADALRGGSEALDRLIVDAREAGDVFDRDLIQRAELLDDKFDELTRKFSTFFRTPAVDAACPGTSHQWIRAKCGGLGLPAQSGRGLSGHLADYHDRLPLAQECLAVRLARGLPESHPAIALAHANLGVALGRLKQWGQAETELGRALALDEAHRPGTAKHADHLGMLGGVILGLTRDGQRDRLERGIRLIQQALADPAAGVAAALGRRGPQPEQPRRGALSIRARAGIGTAHCGSADHQAQAAAS